MANYPAIPAQSYITAATHTYSGALTGTGSAALEDAVLTVRGQSMDDGLRARVTGATGAVAAPFRGVAHLSGNLNVDGDVIISGQSSLSDRIAAIEERLCLLVPNFEKMEHFPALKKAYEQYLLIEKLCRKESSNE